MISEDRIFKFEINWNFEEFFRLENPRDPSNRDVDYVCSRTVPKILLSK